MYKLKLYYSVQNGGDGSAYPIFFESEELTRLDQELQEERWGEICNGSIELTSDSPISSNTSIITKSEYLEGLRDELEYCKESKYSKHKIPKLEKAIRELEENEE